MSPLRLFLTLLAIIFIAEMLVMFVLPDLFPGLNDTRWEALPDATMLTVISAPLLWWVIVRPLRRIAVQEQARSESIVAAAVEGIITIDGRGVVETFNRAAEQIFGYEAKEVVGHSLTILMPERLAGRHQRAMRDYLSTGESRLLGQTVELPGRKKDGSEVPLAVSVVAIRPHGRQLFTGVVRDLTERKRIEAERQSRQRMQAVAVEFGRRALACEDLSTLLNEAAQCIAQTLSVPFSGVWEWLPDGGTLILRAGMGWKEGMVGNVTWNARACDRADEERYPCAGFLAGGADRKHCNRCPSLFHEHGVTAGISITIQGSDRPYGILGAYATGDRTFAKDDVHFLQDIAIEVTLAVQRKRAELRQRERDMMRAEQMAAVAQIATGVAHEIRNPLTSIKLLVQANQEEEGRAPLNADDLRIIEGEIRRMEQCLQTFLDFARPTKPERRLLGLETLVERTFALVEARAHRQRVGLCFKPPQEPVLVEADWGQVQQLLLNLALNALDVMPQGGTLEVVLRQSEGHAELAVLDTGPGIAPQILSQLFQPFVTSKETGMGLGLVISRRIAEDHGGELTAHNRPEGGACFALRLPLTAQGPEDRGRRLAAGDDKSPISLLPREATSGPDVQPRSPNPHPTPYSPSCPSS